MLTPEDMQDAKRACCRRVGGPLRGCAGDTPTQDETHRGHSGALRGVMGAVNSSKWASLIFFKTFYSTFESPRKWSSQYPKTSFTMANERVCI